MPHSGISTELVACNRQAYHKLEAFAIPVDVPETADQVLCVQIGRSTSEGGRVVCPTLVSEPSH
jgi:hypothetical protein